ncbi:hypothetical protein C8D92_102330 [Tamilnaduibacter salinus]|uniref:Uncharacterized protein n=1 Tax=Tamilnaduibacter salinus TaxID=1484056 RepID=A0A2U1CZS1_9GAMM|nr:hypothetical protein [Tamilnaduibacter salinus]PVY78290.1 hypothetical protein C8D92_102330 [Tamilnaduibacter salinus]
MTPESELAYGVFWTLYVAGFALFFWVFSRAIRSLPLYGMRSLLKAALIAALLTPVASTEAANWWIPAWLHGGYEVIQGHAEEAARAFSNLTLAGGSMFIVWLLDLVWYRWRHPTRGDRAIFSRQSS